MQDGNGKYVSCCAHGRHAENEDIQERSTVVLFFAVAQTGLNNNPGYLWLYNETHVRMQKRNVNVPPSAEEIVIGAAGLWIAAHRKEPLGNVNQIIGNLMKI